ncbi:MAG: DUF6567 family protein [Chryseotalea sp.]
MKTLYKLSLIFLLTPLLGSCIAFHSGYLSNSAALNSANFTYVNQNIKGQAEATYFVLFGGLGKETLVHDAKEKMLASFPLKNNQALANQTVNFKYTFILMGFARRVTCTVTADVVEFNQ